MSGADPGTRVRSTEAVGELNWCARTFVTGLRVDPAATRAGRAISLTIGQSVRWARPHGGGGVDGCEWMWSIVMTLEIVPVVLDELVLTVVVDNATDNLS